jgi:hypothetical protein
MSVLAELQERVQKTNALIAQCERTIASAGIEPPPSALASIRSLEKLKRRLEAEYLGAASQLELEVYRYRILNESERVTLPGIAEAWAGFQTFFASVYTALTESQTKRKKPVQSQRLELGYGYSFASSIGVVVTVPKDVGIYATSPIEEASGTVFDLIEAKNVASIARGLGPTPIRALNDWIGVHVRHQYGLGLEWHSAGQIKRSTLVQYQSLTRLQSTIGEATTETGLDVIGKLYAVNQKTGEFKLEGDNGQEYQGQFGEAITMEHAASVPARYKARIIQTTKIIVLGKEPETTYFLEGLTSL